MTDDYTRREVDEIIRTAGICLACYGDGCLACGRYPKKQRRRVRRKVDAHRVCRPKVELTLVQGGGGRR